PRKVSAIRSAAVLRRALGLSAGVASLVGALPAVASAARHSTSATTPACSAPALAQIYSWAQDTNWYAAIPGEKWDSFSSGGWTLSGGAKFVTTTLADGKRGTMLYMPSGAKAVSPSVCVTNSYPAAR